MLRRLVLRWLFPDNGGARPETVDNAIRDIMATVSAHHHSALSDFLRGSN